MTERRVRIQWTEAAKKGLAGLPPTIRRGILQKADILLNSDPTRAFKGLSGPLHGLYSMPYSRYRAIYSVIEEKLSNGDHLVTVIVRFVATGIRKEGSRKDVYNLVQKLLRQGSIIDEDTSSRHDAPDEPE